MQAWSVGSGIRHGRDDAVPALPRFIGQELTVQGNDYPIALGIFLLGYVHAEVDGAHNTFTERLVNTFLDGKALDVISEG